MTSAAAKPNRWIVRIAATILCCSCVAGWTQNVRDGFDPNVNDSIIAITGQSDGKILIGGAFTKVGGQDHVEIARLNPDGSVDSSFNTTITGSAILAIALQTNGKILIGGQFTQVGATAAQNIARLNADGTTDTSFNAMVDDVVSSIAVQNDGKIVLGGNFHAGSDPNSGGVTRLNSDGSADSSFIPPPLYGFTNDNSPAVVNSVKVQPDGRILAGGYIFLGGSSVGIVRLLPNGTLDPDFQISHITYNSTPVGTVTTFALQADGEIVIGGQFDNISGVARNDVARLHTDGSVDQGFGNNTFGDAIVYSVLVDFTGNIVVGGEFTSITGSTRGCVARISANGVLEGFAPDLNCHAVYTLALQSDNALLLGGAFTSVGSATRNNMARVGLNNGALDTTLDIVFDNQVNTLAVQTDGSLLVGGSFTSIASTARNRLARILPDGTLDPGYDPNANQFVVSIAIQANGSALVGGSFTTIDNRNQAYLAHLTAAGNVETAFAPVVDATVRGIIEQPDGKILLRGDFTQLNGAARNQIGRLNADGSTDSFTVLHDADIDCTALQGDGKILAGGSFTLINGHAAKALIRLNANGSIDTAFVPDLAFVSAPSSLAVKNLLALPDGRILVAGFFNTVDGQQRIGIARLQADGSLDANFFASITSSPPVSGSASPLSMSVLSDGKILIGGFFNTVGNAAHASLARLNSNGSVDSSFVDLGVDGDVLAMAVMPDGKISIGGDFAHVGGLSRPRLARLSLPEAAQQALAVSDNTVYWARAGSSAALAGSPSLLLSTDDGATFATVGAMTLSGTWQFSGFQPPIGQTYFLRVQAPLTSGLTDGSQGRAQFTAEFYLDDEIFKNGFE